MAKKSGTRKAVKPPAAKAAKIPQAGTISYLITANGADFGIVFSKLRKLQFASRQKIATRSTIEIVVTTALLAQIKELEKYGKFVDGRPNASMLAQAAPRSRAS